MRAALACLCLLLSLSAERAEAKGGLVSKNTVGILSIQTRGVSELVAGQFEREIEEALFNAALRSLDRETLQKRLADSDYIEGCTFGPCLSVVRAELGIPLVLVARLDRVGSSYNVVITIIDTKTGMFTSQVAQPCEVCTIDEAISTATTAMIALLHGTGGAEVSEFSSSAASTTDLRSYRKSKPLKKSMRRTGLIFLGAGVVGGGLAAYFWKKDQDTGMLLSGAGGAAFITSGATMMLLSRRF